MPDGDPEVRLQGFGLEDTHSVANSLVFGPDGWLYGAQGSTVSASIMRPGVDKPADAIRTMGQNIWRYHPERNIYEVFAEGGGNAYGVEIDGKGRIYSGHNGGDTRGFHYVQGGYYQKSFNKHGDHSNPHTYGFLPPMKNAAVARFVHQFIVYESTTLPESYRGKLIGVDVLHNNLVRSTMIVDGSTFRTEDVDRPISSKDSWFRPVMVTEGPDGNLYIADWYDKQVNHYRNHEGQIDRAMGRVYRVRAKGSAPGKASDLAAATDGDLLGVLASTTRWRRMTALRLLAERRPTEILDTLVTKESLTLEELWLVYQCGRWEEGLEKRALGDRDPSIRLWAVRLSSSGERLAALASSESSPEVRVQLAASARRLSVGEGLPVLAALLRRSEDLADPQLSLMCWWGIEAKCAEAPEAVLALFREKDLWTNPMVREEIIARLMRRFASLNNSRGWERCARLFALSPDEETRRKLIEGFEAATKGSALSGLPHVLLEELSQTDGNSALVIRMRRGDAAALREGLASEFPGVIEVFGEIDYPDAVPVLLERFLHEKNEALRRACLVALGPYGGKKVGDSLVQAFPNLEISMKEAVANQLCGRAQWAGALLDAIESQAIAPGDVPLPLVRKLRALGDPTLLPRVERVWGTRSEVAAGEEVEIARIVRILREGEGVPKRGEAIFRQRCAACHTLFGKGGEVGPELTSYQRDDLASMLLSIVSPGAEIREGYDNILISLKDGRVLGGFLAGQDTTSVVLRDFAGQTNRIARSKIEKLKAAGASLMPSGLLSGLEDGAVRDLIAYLRSTTPPF